MITAVAGTGPGTHQDNCALCHDPADGSRISGTYDLLNRLMTFGQDLKWRRETVAQLDHEGDGIYLDLGSGTGDLIAEISFTSSRHYY